MNLKTLSKSIYAVTAALLLLLLSPISFASDSIPDGPFTQATSISELKQLVNKSVKMKKPVLIYFFATWCHFCQAVNRNVFSDSEVQSSLGKITAISVNSSDNTPSQVEMMDKYNVQVFPTIIVYSSNGRMMEPSQFQTGITKNKMLAVLKELNN